MKILDSICEVPRLNIPGRKEVVDGACKNVKYSLNDEVQITHWAVSVCRRILEENNIAPEEIGVIVGNSISVSGTTEDTDSAAPGVCHSVQRDLGISNAFVFDLFHSDWCTALEISGMFLSNQSPKYGLVIKAEKFNNFNNHTGFSWSDGISIMLFENEVNAEASIQHFHMDDKKINAAALSFITNENITTKAIRFLIEWDLNPDAFSSLLNKQEEIINSYKEQESENSILSEKWFSKPSKDALMKDNYESDAVGLGAHFLPWSIQQLKSSGKEILNKKLRMISFNPFLLQYTSLIINI